MNQNYPNPKQQTNYLIMKVKIVITCWLIFCSCSGHEIEPIIVWKSHRTFGGNKMPEGICRFGYKTMSNGSVIEFEDSCYKYEIGQIIKPNQ